MRHDRGMNDQGSRAERAVAVRKVVKAKRKIDLGRRAEIGKQKRARTRKQILDVAFLLLGREHGLSTRIEEICEAAGISRGTFYNHFSTTEELFAGLSYELSHDFNVAVTALLNRLPTAAQRVSAAVRYYIERALSDPQWGWAMVNVSAGGPIFGADTHAAALATAAEGIAAGEFDLPRAELGRDLQVGAALAAIQTQLREPQSHGYAAEVANRVLLGMGISRESATAITNEQLAPIA